MRTIISTVLATAMVGGAGGVSAQETLQRLEERQFGQPRQPLVIDPERAREREKAAERGYLGVVTDDGTDRGRGVRVIEVVKGSPAEEAGIKVGDLITAIAEKPVRQTSDVPEATKGSGPGAKLGVTVVRDGAMRTILVTLGRRPDDAKLPPPPPEKTPGEPPAEPRPGDVAPAQPGQPPMPAPQAAGDGPPKLGVLMRSYADDPRSVLGRPPVRGVQVLEVLASTPAAAAGMRPGDIIIAVDGAAVGDTQELRDAMAARRGGDEAEISYYRGRVLYRQKIRVAGGLAGESPLPAPPAAAFPREVTDRQRIEALERRVQELEGRLAELEKRLEKPPPAKE
jgi:membrane-associated protease RseP (regulator of RpoE activity)